jgi:hypothetical protein
MALMAPFIFFSHVSRTLYKQFYQLLGSNLLDALLRR